MAREVYPIGGMTPALILEKQSGLRFGLARGLGARTLFGHCCVGGEPGGAAPQKQALVSGCKGLHDETQPVGFTHYR
jgi:hypothetical protein